MIMDSSKNRRYIIPFKKFSRLRVKKWFWTLTFQHDLDLSVSKLVFACDNNLYLRQTFLPSFFGSTHWTGNIEQNLFLYFNQSTWPWPLTFHVEQCHLSLTLDKQSPSLYGVSYTLHILLRGIFERRTIKTFYGPQFHV